MEVLKQGQYVPQSVERQVVQIYAATQKDKTGTPWVRHVPVKDMIRYCAELTEYVESRHPALLKEMAEKKDLTDSVRKQLDEALTAFRDTFQVSKA